MHQLEHDLAVLVTSCFRWASFWSKYLNFLEIGGLVGHHMTSRVPWSPCLWLVILYSNARLMKVRKTLPKLHLLHPKGKKIAPQTQGLEDYMVSFSEALCIPFAFWQEWIVMFQDHNKNWATEVTEFKNPRQCPAFGGNGVSAIGLRAWCLTTCGWQ